MTLERQAGERVRIVAGAKAGEQGKFLAVKRHEHPGLIIWLDGWDVPMWFDYSEVEFVRRWLDRRAARVEGVNGMKPTYDELAAIGATVISGGRDRGIRRRFLDADMPRVVGD